jgi:hypothetical protein
MKVLPIFSYTHGGTCRNKFSSLMRRKPYPLWDEGFTYAFVDEHPLNQEY